MKTWNEDNQGKRVSLQILNESHKVKNNKIILNCIPDPHYKINIFLMTEITQTNLITTSSQFKTNYETGEIFFYSSLENTNIIVNSYYSTGKDSILAQNVQLVNTNNLYNSINVEEFATEMSNGFKNLKGTFTNSLDYGIKNDGVTLDNSYIQNAINDSVINGNKAVFIPNTSFYDLGSLSIPSSVILFNEQSIIDFNATQYESTLYLRRAAKFTGGAAGYVNGAIYAYSEVGSGVTSYEWGITSTVDVYASAGEHVGIYSKITRIDGNGGGVWGATIEVIDSTGSDTLGSNFIGIELNMKMNGSNTNANRIGIDLISRTYGTGTRGELSSGIRLDGDGRFKVGVNFMSDMDSCINIISNATQAINLAGVQTYGVLMGGTKVVGIDLSGATYSTSAIRLAHDQYVDFEATSTIRMKYNNTTGYLEFYNGATRKGYIDMNGTDHAL